MALNAADRFMQTMDRAERQIDLHRLLQESLEDDPHGWGAEQEAWVNVAELLRTALVLAVSAMDAYFTRKFAERFVPYLRQNKAGLSMEELLRDAGVTLTDALSLIPKSPGQRPLRKLRTMLENHLDEKTTQRTDTIDELYEAFGIKSLSANAERKAKRTRLLTSVRKAVKRRHVIVHDGDLNAHGRLQPIDCGDVVRWVRDIALFVVKCDGIISNAVG